MTTGRPTEYRPEYCELVVKLGEAGEYPVEWAAQIGVAKKTLHRWKEEFPAFCHAYDLAFTKCEASHMRKTRTSAESDIGSAPLLKWLGSAVFGYREAMDVDNTHSGPGGKPIETKNETIIRIVRPAQQDA